MSEVLRLLVTGTFRDRAKFARDTSDLANFLETRGQTTILTVFREDLSTVLGVAILDDLTVERVDGGGRA